MSEGGGLFLSFLLGVSVSCPGAGSRRGWTKGPWPWADLAPWGPQGPPMKTAFGQPATLECWCRGRDLGIFWLGQIPGPQGLPAQAGTSIGAPGLGKRAGAEPAAQENRGGGPLHSGARRALRQRLWDAGGGGISAFYRGAQGRGPKPAPALALGCSQGTNTWALKGVAGLPGKGERKNEKLVHGGRAGRQTRPPTETRGGQHGRLPPQRLIPDGVLSQKKAHTLLFSRRNHVIRVYRGGRFDLRLPLQRAPTRIKGKVGVRSRTWQLGLRGGRRCCAEV